MVTYSIPRPWVYIFLNLNRRFYKLVRVTWNPIHKLKYIYLQWNKIQKQTTQKTHNKYNMFEPTSQWTQRTCSYNGSILYNSSTQCQHRTDQWPACFLMLLLWLVLINLTCEKTLSTSAVLSGRVVAILNSLYTNRYMFLSPVSSEQVVQTTCWTSNSTVTRQCSNMSYNLQSPTSSRQKNRRLNN